MLFVNVNKYGSITNRKNIWGRFFGSPCRYPHHMQVSPAVSYDTQINFVTSLIWYHWKGNFSYNESADIVTLESGL